MHKKSIITITVDSDILKKIELDRGLVARSRYIDNILSVALKEKKS